MSENEKELKFGPFQLSVPDSWDKESVSSLYENASIGTDSRGSEGEDSIPLIKMGDLKIGNLNIDEPERISEELVSEEDILSEGDLLFNTRNSPKLVGKTAMWDGRYRATYDNNILRVRLNDEVVPRYINYYLSSGVGWKQLKSRVQGTTSVAALYQGEFDKVGVPLPPLAEQRRIASILYSVDEQIRTLTDRHDSLTQLKHGLMQDLLTGETRVTTETTVHDDVETASPEDLEAVQESESREIHNISWEENDFDFFAELQRNDSIELQGNWNLHKLHKIAEFEYGDHLPERNRNTEGSIPVYDSNGIVDTHDTSYVDSDGLVIARKGSIGSVSYSSNPFYPIDTTYYISKNESNQNLLWLYYLIDLLDLNRVNASTAIPSLNRDDAGNLTVPVPPLWEQERIASILYTVDEMIARTSDLIDEYERLNRGLMQDLLSGDVRTPEDLSVLDEIKLDGDSTGADGSSVTQSTLDV